MTTSYQIHLKLTGKIPITWDEFSRLMRFAIAAVIQLAAPKSTPETTTHPKP